MKSFIKIISSCFCAGAMLYGSAQPPQKIKFFIQNNTDVPVFGNIYNTSATGKVKTDTDKSPFYYQIPAKSCRSIEITKPAKNRASNYHRLIFSSVKEALKKQVVNNNRQSLVASALIPQKNFLLNLVVADARQNECYSIQNIGTDKNDHVKIKIIRESSCGDNSSSCPPAASQKSEFTNLFI